MQGTPIPRILVALALVVTFTRTATLPAESVWIEGEAASQKQVTPNSWYDGVKYDVLSGNAWLSHFDESRTGLASYNFEVQTSGEYAFWVRANHVKSSLSYRLNGGEWQTIDMDGDQRGAMNIANDNKPDLRFIAWIKAGRVKLEPGPHKLELRLNSRLQNHGAIDCFCLTTDPWVPSGTLKPSALPSEGKPDEWFAVVLGEDPLSTDSIIDVSGLIEAPAGRQGFLQADGDALRFEKAKRPIKFWGINAHPQGRTPEDMRQAARWFRKHGINLVRQHTMIEAVGFLDAQGRFDAGRLDRYDRWFAALKEQGIYSTWSVFYPHHGAFLRRQDGYDPALFAELDESDNSRDGGRQPIVVNDYVNLDRDLQDIVLRYFDALLNHVNPHTGLAYKDDPALAVLEFQNESNVFFHTLNGLREGKPPRFARQMRRGFFEFVKAKYGDKQAAGRAWNNSWDRDDRWEAGELGLMGAFHWGSDGPLYEYSGQFRRTGDYIEFLTKLQRGYYERREQEVRSLGFRGVTVTTAWKAGGPAAGMANLFADTAAGMIDRHNYFGGGAGGHNIAEGEVSNQTHLSDPGRGLLSLGLFQVADKPFCVSEWSMLPPAPYKAEAAPLYAFYGMGLQGWDASCHFACNAGSMGDGWPSLRKYVTETPHYIGQFPALAFAIYNNHIQPGDVVAARHVSPADLYSGKDVLGQALSGGSWDAKELTGRLTTAPSTLAIGRVTVGFDGDKSPVQADLKPFHNVAEQTLRSTTGELLWDYGQRRVEVRSKQTQAVIGFTKGGRLNLPSVELDVTTPFISLIFTPLDNEPLAQSRHVLITALARDKQTGAEFNEDWSALRQVGGPPLLLEPVQAVIKLAGSRPTRVRPVDGYGVPRNDELPISADGSFVIDGRYQAYYYEVTR